MLGKYRTQSDANFSLVETSDPPVAPVTLQEAKDHLRLTDGSNPHEHNDMLRRHIEAATNEVEGHINRALVQRTFEYRLPTFWDLMKLPVTPVQSITSIQYIDTNGVTQTLATSVYGADLNSEPPYIYLDYGQSWPGTRDIHNAVTITFVGGYASVDSGDSPAITDYRKKIPEGIKQAILLLVEDMYEFTGTKVTGTIVQHSDTIDRLLSKYRVY